MMHSVEIWGYVFAALVGVLGGVAAYPYRHDWQGKTALFMLASIGGYYASVVVEAVLPTFSQKVWWLRVEYTFVAFIGPSILFFLLAYTHRLRQFSTPILGALLLIPFITVIAAWTNVHHHLLWLSVKPLSDSPFVYPEYGPLFWLHTLYQLFTTVAGLFTLFLSFPQLPPRHKILWTFVSSGLVISLIAVIFYLSRVTVYNFSAWAFALSGLSVVLLFSHFHALRLTPVSRDITLERLRTGVLMVNVDGYILDANEAMVQILGASRESLLGKPVDVHLRRWPDLLFALNRRGPQQVELRLPSSKGEGEAWYQVRVDPVTSENGEYMGAVLIWQDVTRIKTLESHLRHALRREREERLYAETLREITLALSAHSTTDAVMDEILQQVERLIPYDAANIALLEGEAVRVVRWRGYEKFGIENYVTDLVQPLETYAIPRRVLRTKSPVVVQDTRADPEWSTHPETAWIRSHISIPIEYEGRILGMVRLDSTKPYGFTEEDARRLLPFASIMGTALIRARLYDQLHAAEARLREIFESVPVGLYRSTPDGRIVEANPALVDILRAPDLETLLSTPATHLYVHPEDREHWRAYLDQHDTYMNFEVQLRRFDGEIIWVSNTGRVVRDANGRTIAYVGYIEDVTEQVRIREERERFLLRMQRQQEALGRFITHPAIIEGDLETALPFIVRVAADTLGVERASIWRISDDRQQLDRLVFYPDTTRLPPLRATYDLTSQEACRVLPTLHETETFQCEIKADDGTAYRASQLLAPVQIHGKTWGIVAFVRLSEDASWTPEEIRFATEVADVIAQALLNAEIRERSLQLHTLYTTIADITSEHDLNVLLPRIVERATALLGGTGGGMYLTDPTSQTVRCVVSYNTQRDYTGVVLKYGEGSAGLVAETGEPLIIPDYSVWDNQASPYREEKPFRAVISAPMKWGDEVLGVIHVLHDRPGYFTQEHLDLLMTFARQAAIAVHNARMFEEIQRRAHYLETLNSIIIHATHSTEIGSLLEEILDRLMATLDADIGILRTRVHETWRSLPPEFVEEMGKISHLHASTMENPTVVDDWLAIDEASPLAPIARIMVQYGFRSSITVPLEDKEHLGCITVGSSMPRHWDEEEVALLRSVAHQLVGVVQRWQLWQRIEAEARRLQQLLDTLPEGVILLDTEYRILMSNPRARAYFPVLGIEQEDRPLSHLGHVALNDLLQTEFRGLAREVIGIGGHDIFEVLVQPVERNQQLIGWILVVRDVTREREIQRRIQQHQRLAALGQMAAGIAHDFNNILQGIIGFSQLLLNRDDLPPDVKRRLQLILEGGQRGATLVRRIMDFSRRTVAYPRPMDLRETVAGLVEWMHGILPSHIRLSYLAPERPVRVYADPDQIAECLTNLIANARDAMPEGGDIVVEVGSIQVLDPRDAPVVGMPKGRWAFVRVTDTGQGIPSDILPHIFEPFFTTKDVDKGVGLGLSQVYGIVQQHKGYIDVQSEVGEGTTFVIYLPVYEEKVQEQTPRDATLRNAVGILHNRRVIVVARSAMLAQTVREQLRPLGVHTTWVTTPEECVHMVGEGAQDVVAILAEWSLARERSLPSQVVQRLDVPLIGILPEGFDPAMGHSEEACSSCVTIHWPFSREELVSALAQVMERAA